MRAFALGALLVAGCASPRDPAFAHRRELIDDGLVVWRAGDEVLGAEHGCARRSCTSVLLKETSQLGGLTVAPFHDVADWYLLAYDVSSEGDFGAGSSQNALLVHRGNPPAPGCTLFLGGHGCSYEYGWCQDTQMSMKPVSPDWATFDTRVSTSSTSPSEATAPRCTRYTLSRSGTCMSTDIDCQAFGAPR